MFLARKFSENNLNKTRKTQDRLNNKIFYFCNDEDEDGRVTI